MLWLMNNADTYTNPGKNPNQVMKPKKIIFPFQGIRLW